MNKINSFVKSFVALVTGDSSTVRAEKTKRQADSALKTHISILNGDLVGKEDAVTEAQENEAKALVNYGSEITNRDNYVKALLEARNKLTLAEEQLRLHKEKTSFLQSKLDSLDKEEEQE